MHWAVGQAPRRAEVHNEEPDVGEEWAVAVG